MEITEIIVHNSGGLAGNPRASTKHHTIENINEAHKARWPEFISNLGWHIGYTFVIFPDGQFIQTREIGEEGAHCKGRNSSSVGICLLGNFTKNVDTPTDQQRSMLAWLSIAIMEKDFKRYNLRVVPGTEINIKVTDIVPHRIYKHATDCYGNSLPDTWARKEVTKRLEIQISLLEYFREQYRILISRKRSLLGGPKFDCLSEAR